MKELSIEEKAKAYDEAIDKIKYVMEHGVSPTLNKEDLQDIFPELKESEDEGIVKEIIDYLKERKSCESYGQYIVRYDRWIAWLEKQCEKPDANKEYWRGYREGKQEVLDKYSELEKQCEQKPYGQREECVDCQFNYAGECKGFCAMKRGEQKPAWSEEDERNLNDAILFVETGTYSLDKDNLINWLKSLRPQNRCGWNDMSVKPIYPCDILYQQPNGNMFIYRYIEGGRANDAQTPTFCNLDENGKWIYLKDIKPQNTWKPSDEQINTLEYYMHTLVCNEHKEILFGLYTDLKKLK